MDAIVARQDNHHKTLQTERLRINCGLSASTVCLAFIINVLLLRKYTLVSETGKGGEDGLKEARTNYTPGPEVSHFAVCVMVNSCRI